MIFFNGVEIPRFDDSNVDQLIQPSRTADGAPQCLPRRTICGGPGTAEMGLAPVLDYPDMLVDQKDWKEVIKTCHDLQLFAMYHLANTGLGLEKWFQNGLGYCWTWGLTLATMGARAAEGLPPVLLSPKSNGYMVNWRNQGWYCDRAIASCRERGIASAEFVPIDNYRLDTRNTADFKPGWEQDALQHRPLSWWDTSPQDGPIKMISQCLAVLRTGRAGYMAHNWEWHALTTVGMEWDESAPYNIAWLEWNSDGDGIRKLATARGIPDELYGVRETNIESGLKAA